MSAGARRGKWDTAIRVALVAALAQISARLEPYLCRMRQEKERQITCKKECRNQAAPKHPQAPPTHPGCQPHPAPG